MCNDELQVHEMAINDDTTTICTIPGAANHLQYQTPWQCLYYIVTDLEFNNAIATAKAFLNGNFAFPGALSS
jgi:hypothetical protein